KTSRFQIPNPKKALGIWCLGFGLFWATPAPAQRVAPPPPPTYDVQVRYRIRVGRNERIVQFGEMVRYLESIGFKRVESEDPNEPADPNAERLFGTLPSNRVADLLREPHLRTVLLTPAGYKLPENPEQRVLVQLKLAGGLSTARERDLYFQVLDKLVRLGFIEKVGYDHEGFTRVLGTIPASDVELLIRDLRLLPAGWLTPETPVDDLPEPIRSVNPIRVVEVLPEPEGVPPSQDVPPPSLPPVIDRGLNPLAKIAPDLRAAGEGGAAIRFEVVLTRTPAPADVAWHDALLAQPNLAIEGRIGPVVSVLAPAAAIRALAALPEVATVRPARVATIQPAGPPPGRSAAVLTATGLDRLHGLNYHGAGVRVCVIDADFAGLTERLGKELPKNTVYLDLTAARNYTLQPDPSPAGTEIGRGTRLALAVRLAAPEADLILVRVDPAAMYQLLTVARYVHGDAFRPESLVSRNRELLADNDLLRVERTKLTEERRALQNEFSQEEEYVQRRKAVEARTADLAQREQQYHDRLNRFFALESGLIELRRVNVVVCPLAWDEGYPFDGSGPLSRYLDDVFYGRPRGGKHLSSLAPPPEAALAGRNHGLPPSLVGKGADGINPPLALWFQSAGNTRDQVWNGPLHDADGNYVFEFGPPAAPLPAGRWSHEVNFLAFQPGGADRTFDLPAGARVRVALQWTEAHDPAVSDLPGPDLYRVPLANLRLMVLRQRDPSGTKVASDDFNVVARNDPLPQLIERHPNWATYEHVIEFAADAPGRYALRLEGTIPPTTRPDTVPSLPALDRGWEAYGRLFVSTAGAAGRVVMGDYQPGRGGLGAPGNALLPRTVGAADDRGRPQPYSAGGPPAGQELMVKPTVLMFDELSNLPPVSHGGLNGGTEQAAAFAAGMYASMLSAGVPEGPRLTWLCLPPGGLMRVPPAWLEQLERRWPKTGRE
ncbi:MAG TPA: hypothetical protein VGF55_22475, partial [Gemmataceae bacterium]